ncbi:LuxR C-terminal-related transcriptional regulator [Streptomyces sp. NPDC001135]
MFTPKRSSLSFTGRGKELRLLREALDHSMANGATVYTITGELGIGRSALLREFRTLARGRGALVIRMDHAHQPDRREDGDEDLATHPATSTEALPAPADRRLCTAAEVALHAAGGRAPVVVTVDDACRAPAAALSRLRRTLDECSHLPVVVALSTRQGEEPRAPRELAQLTHGAHQLVLEGLSTQETAGLARSQLRRSVRPELAAALHRLSAGNPFMLRELLDWVRQRERQGCSTDLTALEAAVLAPVAEAVTGRLNMTDPALGPLAALIAVVGQNGQDAIRLVAHLSGMPLEQTLLAAGLLVGRGLIADDATLRLRHPLLRTALADRMTGMARSATHLKAAGYLHRIGAPPALTADHLIASGAPLDSSWSAGVLLRAGHACAAAHDHEAAQRFLTQALRVATGPDHREALLLLAEVRLRTDWADGIQAIVEMLALADDDSARAQLLHRLGWALYAVPDPEETERVLSATADAVAGTGLARWHELHRATTTLFDEPPAVTAQRLAQVLPAPPAPGLPPAMSSPALHTAVNALRALCQDLDTTAPRSALKEAYQALDQHAGNRPVHPLAVPAALAVLLHNGHIEAAAEHLHRHSPPGDGSFPPRDPLLQLAAVHIALERGRLTTAREELGACLHGLSAYCGDSSPRVPFLAPVVGLLADVLVSLGDYDQAWALLRRHHSTRKGAHGWHGPVLLARARLQAASGDLPAAARDLTELVRHCESLGIRPTATVSWRRNAVVLMQRTGLLEQARQAADLQILAVETSLDLARALRALAAVSDEARREGLLREAVGLLERDGNELDLACVKADLGALLTRLGRQSEAAAELTQAVGLASRCGAQPMAEHAKMLLAAGYEGDRERSSLRGMFDLTARERQILLEAAQGSTNRQIASVHGITRRTVELHLSSAYRKLGITGRRDFQEIFRTPGALVLLGSTGRARLGTV